MMSSGLFAGRYSLLELLRGKVSGKRTGFSFSKSPGFFESMFTYVERGTRCLELSLEARVLMLLNSSLILCDKKLCPVFINSASPH